MDQRRKTDRKLNRESGIRFLEKQRSFHGKATFLRIFLILMLALYGTIQILEDTLVRTGISQELLLRMALLFLLAALGELFYERTYLRLAARSAYYLLIGWILYHLYRKKELLLAGVEELQNHVIYAYRAFGNNEVYQGTLEAPGRLLFLLLCMFLLLAAYEFFYYLKLREAFFLPILITFCIGLVLGKAPGAKAVLAVTMMFWLLYGIPWKDEWSGQREFLSGKEKALQKSAGILQKTLSLSLVLGALLLGLLLFRGGKEQMLSYYDKVQQFQWDLEDAAVGAWNKVIAAFFPSRMDHSLDNESPQYANEEVMTIRTGQKPEGALYLCGFEGDTIENGEWKNASRKFAKACKDYGIGEEEARETLLTSLNIRLQSDMRSNGKTNTIHSYTITYTDSGMHDLFYPYYLYPQKNQLTQLSGDGLNAGTGGGKTATVETGDPVSGYWWLNTQELIDHGYGSQNFWDWYNAYAVEIGTQSVASEQAEEWIRDTLAVEKYRELLASEDLETRNHARFSAATNVSNYLKMHFRYSWNLDPLPEGTDVVGYFLTEGKAGYCMHFASAGVTILREMGIPARLASGYIVMPESFRVVDRTEYEASVPDSNAHAWVEVYYDNIGWIPVEMTPGYGDGPMLPTDPEAVEERQRQEEERDSSEEESTQLTETESESEEVMSEESEEAQSELREQAETESEESVEAGRDDQQEKLQEEEDAAQPDMAPVSGSRKTMPKGIRILLWFLLIGGGIYGAFALLRLRMQRIQDGLLQDLKKHRYRRAVLRINTLIYRKLQLRTKKPLNSITDEEFEKLLIEQYPQVSEEEWGKYMRIVKKIAFSKLSPADDEAQLCRDIYERLR